MPPRRDLEQADLAARTMFNVFPQGVGEQVSRGASSLAGTAMGVINRFTNPFGAFVSDVGAARQAVSGTPLIGRRQPMQEVATAPTPVLPSGTPMVGFDAYPTIPKNVPITTSTLRPSTAAPTPLTPEEERYYNFSRLSPYSKDVVSAVSQPAPTGIAGGTMGGLPSVVPQFPSQQYREPMAPVTMGITGATERKGVRTAYGMIYPTAEQEAAAQQLAQLPTMSARMANIRQDIDQQQRLALVRQNAMLANQQRNQIMQNFAAERRQSQQFYTTPSGSSIAAPTNRFGQPIEGFQQIYAQRQQGLRDDAANSAAMLAGTGFGAMRRTQEETLPAPIRSQSLYGGLGYASTFGGPQPATSLAAGPAIRSRRRILGTV